MTMSGATPTSFFGWHAFSRLTGFARGIGEALISALFPPVCALCGRSTDELSILCPVCEARLPKLEGPRCVRCGEPVEDRGLDICLACGTREQPVDRALFLGPYDGAWGDLVRFMKFDREVAIARDLGRRLAERLKASDLDSGFDWVTFVPMSRKDRRQRRFNQSELLARVVAHRMGVPVRRALVKTMQTPRQGSLGAAERRLNLRGVFRPVPFSGERVLLVDDIVTTGSTVEECAWALRQGGANSVTILAVARA